MVSVRLYLLSLSTEEVLTPKPKNIRFDLPLNITPSPPAAAAAAADASPPKALLPPDELGDVFCFLGADCCCWPPVGRDVEGCGE